MSEPVLDQALSPATSHGFELAEFLRRVGIPEIVADDALLQSWIANLTYEEFVGHLARLNGIARDLPIKDRDVDGAEVRIANVMCTDQVAFIPPHPDDKEDLLAKTLAALKQLDNRDDMGLVIFLAVQAIHPFLDGNGRLGRIGLHLMRMTPEQTASLPGDLRTLIGHLDGDDCAARDSFCVSPETLENIYAYVNRYCVAPEFLPEEKLRVERIFSCLQLGIVERLRDGRLSAEIASRAESVLGQSSPASWRFGDIALCAFLCRHGRESELEIRELGSPLLWFEGDGLVKGVSEGEIEEVLSIERDVKRVFIEKLLDVFVNPQKHEHCGWTMRDVICREVFGSVPRAARD